MSNMSYCRFENTSADLEDCIEAIQEMTVDGFADLNRTEQIALVEMINQCARFIAECENLDHVPEVQEMLNEVDKFVL